MGCLDGPSACFIILSISFVGTVWIPAFLVNVANSELSSARKQALRLLAGIALLPLGGLFFVTMWRILTVCGHSGEAAIGSVIYSLDIAILMTSTACFAFVVFICLFFLLSG